MSEDQSTIRIAVGKASIVKPGGMAPVSAQGRNYVLVREQDGALYALDDMCTHAEVKLSRGKCENGYLQCPAHGARFDYKTGEVVCPPARRAIRIYPAFEKDGEIYLEISDVA